MELQERLEELRASGRGVAAISYDPQAVLARFAARRGIEYPLLSDVDSATIRAFGILNTVAVAGVGPKAEDPAVKADVERYVSVFGANRGIVGTPFPGTFLVDHDGVVVARFFEDFYRERHTAASIMLRLGTDMSPVAGVEGATAHLGIEASQSNAEITFGSRFSLILDITPNPEIHVYAPGAEELGYRVVKLELAEHPHVRVLETLYPPSETFHFAPLDEDVPVYHERFRLIQEIVVAADREAERALAAEGVLTLSGALEYQACDDEVCFVPVSVPLTWTVAIAPLDTERAAIRRDSENLGRR